nr:ubiquitin hydrolase [Tanacetum cinerariifolium]
MIYHYSLGLSQVEGRLVEQKERELKYLEKIRTLEYYNESYKECIETLKKKLETLQQKKKGVDGKLAGLLTASKDLDNLIKSQRSDKNKEGLGYSVVSPPISQIYSSPKKDLSWIGLPEFADDTINDYSRPSPTVEITSGDDQNRNSSASDNGESTGSILSKPTVKFVKAAERSTTNKVETVKKPSVRYAELYRKQSKKSTVRGNQRNWNNLKSQQLGENFVRKNRACFNCGHFDHLSYNCGLGVKMRRSSPKNNYTHRSMPPRPAIHRPYRPPMRPVRPNIYDAQPKRTSFYKHAHSYNKRPFQETTQDLVAILIQRVQRLERELKSRTPIHKVNRGRSRPVMAWVPKKV